MSRTYEYRRKFTAEILEASIFGAFILAIQTRKHENNLTQRQLASRTGKEKTGISKLLSGPRNWQIQTIATLSEALDVRFEFSLVDRTNPFRKFTSTGIQWVNVANVNWSYAGIDNIPLNEIAPSPVPPPPIPPLELAQQPSGQPLPNVDGKKLALAEAG
jgi:transcriptional regulator with XRE-family HTH domain